VVAGTTSDNTIFLEVAKTMKFIDRTADLKCASALQVFGFEDDLPTELLRQIGRRSNWSVFNHTTPNFARCPNRI
jgi:hypothetical protein